MLPLHVPPADPGRGRATSRRSLRQLFRLLAFVACGLGLAQVPAQAATVSLLAGYYDGYHNLTAAWQSDALWTHALDTGHVDLRVEASAGRAFGPAGQPGAPLWHIGLTPFVDWWFQPGTALEAGIGANLFSGVHIGSKSISTAYQFGDSIGLYHRLAHTPWGIGVRFTHYSNADIKRPNPGQNYLQLRLSYELR